MGIAYLGALGLAAASLAADSKPLREVTREEAAQWKWVNTPQLTPDGRWLAYLAMPAWNVPQGAPATAVLRSTFDETERRYPMGHSSLGIGNLKMSPSGRWVAFQTSDVETPSGEAVQLSLAVVDVESGVRRNFSAVREFEFIAGDDQRLLLAGYAASESDPRFDLTVSRPDADSVHKISAVTAYAVDPLGARLAWADGHGLKVRDFHSGHTPVLDSFPGASYNKLTWSSRGTALAALRSETRGVALVTFTGFDRAVPQKTEFLPGTQKALPKDMEIAAPMLWRADEHGLYFSLRPMAQSTSAPIQANPNLALWHWRDDQLPGEKKADAGQRPSYWCFVNLMNKHVVRLSDEALPDVVPHERGAYVLGYDVSRYGWQNKNRLMQGVNAPQVRDYYLVSLSTGQRAPLMQGLRTIGRNLSIAPQLSPDGTIILYQDNDGDYIAYEIENGASRNLTSALDTKFYFEENDPKRGRQPRDGGQGAPTLQGWSDDGSYVLISDYYDVWALPVRVGQARTLTGRGRGEDLSYRRIVLTEQIGWQGNGSQSPVNLHAPIYFQVSNLKTGQTGLARWSPERGGLETLHMEDANVHYYKAKRAEVYIYSRMTSVESEDYYLVGAQWRPSARLTDINLQQRAYRWPPKAKYLTYKTSRGDIRHAVLYLPINYVPGKTYPTVVQLYLVISPIVHEYRAPFETESFSGQYQRRGYAFLLPDIIPRINEAGQAAVEDVTAAINAAAATGIVDRDRLGLFGHSYGAYETEFIVSQTNLFKAAAPIAGFSQLWSQYGAVYADRWPYSIYTETSQPFLGGPWWEHWNAYIHNSPLYHARGIDTPLLLIHGDQDTAVPFSQSAELFNTLRRLGKPVVLLQYKGQDHEFESANADDSNQRVADFFDHFLKGTPAPKWWSDGISYYDGQVPLSHSPSEN